MDCHYTIPSYSTIQTLHCQKYSDADICTYTIKHLMCLHFTMDCLPIKSLIFQTFCLKYNLSGYKWIHKFYIHSKL